MKTILTIGLAATLLVPTATAWSQPTRTTEANPPALTVQQWIRGETQTTNVSVHDDRLMALSGARSGMELLAKIFESAVAGDDARVLQDMTNYAAPGGPFGYCEHDFADGIDAQGNCGVNWCKTCYNDFTDDWLGTSCRFITVDPMWCN